MSRTVAIVKRYLVPGSAGFFAVALAASIILFQFGNVAMTVGRVWLLAICLVYWVLSLPAVATALLRQIGRRYQQISDATDAREVEIIVVLGNGSVTYREGALAVSYLTRRTVFCVFEAIRLFQRVPGARIVVSGGSSSEDRSAKPESILMRDLMITFGLPADRIVVESKSRTTDQQAENVADLVGVTGRPALLVTTPAHMRRATSLFKARGVDVIPALTTELRYDGGTSGCRRWWPSAVALRGSETALYECLAIVYAAFRRRFSPRGRDPLAPDEAA